MAAQKEVGLLSEGAPVGNQNAAKQRVADGPVVLPPTLSEVRIDKQLADRAKVRPSFRKILRIPHQPGALSRDNKLSLMSF